MEAVKAFAHGTQALMARALPPLPSTPSGSSRSWASRAPVPAAPASATPPPTPPPVPPPPVATHPTAILDELTETVGGVRAAILASVDGFGLARSSSMPNEASHPAMLAAAVGLAHQLASMSGGTQLRQIVVDHDGGLLLVWPLGDQHVLAVLTTSTVEQRRVRSFVQARAARLTGATS